MRIKTKRIDQRLWAPVIGKVFGLVFSLSIGVVLADSTVDQASSVKSTTGVSIDALRSNNAIAQFTFEKNLYTREQYSGDLYSYLSDGLKVYALVNTPTKFPPADGFPVLVYGHGFHPEPKNYGITNDGVVSRPGDYYRGIPERYASEGYLVITPDYRGHNISEGFEFTQRNSLSSSYYASDVLHLLSAIADIQHANPDKIYYAGHSMGGDVGLKMLLATTKVRAASLWSPAIGSTSQKALYYGRYYDENKEAAVDGDKLRQYRESIDNAYQQFAGPATSDDVDVIKHLEYLSTPLLIQHARGDSSVPYQWSENLVIELARLNKEFVFYAYDSDKHLFEGDNLERAFQRDLAFFKRH